PGQRNGKMNNADETPQVLESTYLAFEDEFRGSREEIKQRVAVYLPALRAAHAATENAPILDVGCGRGEMLEVLRAEGLPASGIDSNGGAVEECKKLGLDVSLGDAFERLRNIADGSLAGLTAI